MVATDVYLRVLGQIMEWDDAKAREELAWVRMMAKAKFDTYRDYVAGAGFIESLADWLQQFSKEHRPIAYDFVKNHLVYVSPGEFQQLVDLAFVRSIRGNLMSLVSEQTRTPVYEIASNKSARDAFSTLLRKTLFLGLSDGARIDRFRRANIGVLSNEQVVVTTQLERPKWDSLLKKLQDEVGDPSARFEYLVLIDDFTASGKTLIRPEDGRWKGKLEKFWGNLNPRDGESLLSSHLSEGVRVQVHHYLGTYRANQRVVELNEKATEARPKSWFQRVEFSFGYVLPESFPCSDSNGGDFYRLCKSDEYYDPEIWTESMRVGNGDGRLGFDECALPLILEHNAPNNSLALLWAETDGGNGRHAMRPLFRRRSRHG